MPELVPSEARPNGLAALTRLAADAQTISAAVAFVTSQGVDLLARVLGDAPPAAVDITARAGGVTEPDALLRLRDELGVEVSLVIGRHAAAFHPKLWLLRSRDRLSVLSGSGNLTSGGLVTNDEQFELLKLEPASDAADDHESRFDLLTAHAVALNDVVGTAIWHEWLSVIKQQRRHHAELRRLEARLDAREVVMPREEDKGRLLDDLDELYERTVAAKLPQRDGRNYVPSRFKQGIDRARRGADPVLLVTRICRRRSEGFDVILNADRPELTVEVLVLDENKPYHDLFTDTTKRLSADRLRLFASWDPDARRVRPA